MSTKIYNAIALGARDIDTLMDQVEAWQKKVTELHAARMTELVTDLAVGIFDRAWLKAQGNTRGESTAHVLDHDQTEPDGPSCPIRQALDSVWNRQRKIRETLVRDPRVDLDFEFFLFRDRGLWYAQARCEQSGWIKEWAAHFEGTEFDYWDNSDHPKNLSAKEWQERGEAWDRMVGRQPPARRGLTVSSVDLAHIPSADVVTAAQISLETRANRLAKSRLMNAALAGLSQPRMSDIVRAMSDHKDWLETKDGSAALAEAVATASAELKPVLTKEDFLNGPVVDGAAA